VLERHHLVEAGIDLEVRRRPDEQRVSTTKTASSTRRSIGLAIDSTRRSNADLFQAMDCSLSVGGNPC